MKRSLLFIFLVVFAFNTLSLSAFAFDCPDGGDTITMKMKAMNTVGQVPCPMMAGMMDDSPPADDDTQQSPCDGLCMCMHVLHAQTLYTSEVIGLSVPVLHASEWYDRADSLASLTVLPPRRPPKFIS